MLMTIIRIYLLSCIEVSKLSIELSMMLFTWVRRIVWMVIVTGMWSCVQLITNTCICMNLETWWMLSSIWSSTWESEKKGNEFISIHKEWWAVNDFIFTTLIIYFLCGESIFFLLFKLIHFYSFSVQSAYEYEYPT